MSCVWQGVDEGEGRKCGEKKQGKRRQGNASKSIKLWDKSRQTKSSEEKTKCSAARASQGMAKGVARRRLQLAAVAEAASSHTAAQAARAIFSLRCVCSRRPAKLSLILCASSLVYKQTQLQLNTTPHAPIIIPLRLQSINSSGSFKRALPALAAFLLLAQREIQ